MKQKNRLLSMLVAAVFCVSANSYGADTATWSSDGVEALSEGATFNGHPIVPDQVLVKYKKDVQAEDTDTALFTMGMWEIKEFQQSGFALLGSDKWRMSKQDQSAMTAEESIKKIIAELEESGVVEYAEPNYILSADVNPTTNDPLLADLWGLYKIEAPTVWDGITTGDPSIVVGVIDTGIDYNHPDLAENMWENPGEIPGNGIDDDNNGYVDDIYGIDPANGDSDPMDDSDHGSHVSGTIGAVGNNGIGVVGVNWNVQIMALKFLRGSGSGSTSDAIECLEYVLMMKQKGVNIKLTNNSWGSGGYSRTMEETIKASGDAGMLFIAAAGNHGINNDIVPHYPSNYTLPNIISVASTTSNDSKSSFSNYGRNSVDLGAPGSSILSTISGNGYATFSGTSMASPHVAGAAAMVWANNPTYSHKKVKNALMSSVDTISELANRTVSGGRLNLLEAMDWIPPYLR